MTPCVNFDGATDKDGYGATSYKRRWVGAHRRAWIEAYGPIPDGKFVLHRCDNRRCINPEHLFLGTTQDNTADRVAKGRSAAAERHGRAKLTADKVREIRRRLAAGESANSLAKVMGVDRSSIRWIQSGRTWRAVT